MVKWEKLCHITLVGRWASEHLQEHSFKTASGGTVNSVYNTRYIARNRDAGLMLRCKLITERVVLLIQASTPIFQLPI